LLALLLRSRAAALPPGVPRGLFAPFRGGGWLGGGRVPWRRWSRYHSAGAPPRQGSGSCRAKSVARRLLGGPVHLGEGCPQLRGGVLGRRVAVQRRGRHRTANGPADVRVRDVAVAGHVPQFDQSRGAFDTLEFANTFVTPCRGDF